MHVTGLRKHVPLSLILDGANMSTPALPPLCAVITHNWRF